MQTSNGVNTICFGQQPCGFFPKRYLYAKITTAKKLQAEIGGRIVFFYHDSDADYRETITILRDMMTNDQVRLNFTQENKLQKKHSPLYAKRITPSLNPSPQGGGKGVEGWKKEILKQLPRFLPTSNKDIEAARRSPPQADEGGADNLINIFTSTNEKTAADFCLEMYNKLGLLEGIEIVRSSNPDFRNQACDIKKGFADVEYEGEIVRAKIEATRLSLHEGGGVYTYLPKPNNMPKIQISPAADERFKWMNSVINCTHYIYGEGEKEYLKFSDFPGIKFIQRDAIGNPEYAWLGENLKSKA